MKQIIFAAILILAFCFTTVAQKANLSPVNTFFTKFDEIMIFDSFGKLSLNEQKARLDNLFYTIAANKNLTGIIEFRLNRNESKKRKMKRFKAIFKHFNRRKVDESRFTLLFIEDEEEQTTIWAQPQEAGLISTLIDETKPYKLIKAGRLEEKINELFPKK